MQAQDVKFRGKDKKTGEWIVGSLYCFENPLPEGGIITDVIPLGTEGYYPQVDPETLGIFLGLVDKNGTDIFSGDIIKVVQSYRENEDDELEYRTLTGEITLERGGVWFHGSGWAIHDWHFFNAADLEVIGNIHDNPGLASEHIE